RGVLDVVHTRNGVVTAHQVRVVVARITVPRRRISRSRLTEGEPSELDEHHFNRNVAAAGSLQRVGSAARETENIRRIVVAEIVELEVALTEGADNTVFGGGTGINRDRHTRTANEVIAEAIALAAVAVIE